MLISYGRATLSGLRYVENNPVRAKLVRQPNSGELYILIVMKGSSLLLTHSAFN
jgi:hypothetical protein